MKELSVPPLAQVGFYSRSYQKHYASLSPEAQKQISRWMPVSLAARLNENIVPEREALIQMIKAGL